MTVLDTVIDKKALTLTFVTEFTAGVERVWQLWEDPRQLERWWGPPTYPATFHQHEFVEGGRTNYYMTSPEGEKYHGYWDLLTIDGPDTLTFRDGFANADGSPDPTLGTTTGVVTLEPVATGTRMTIVSHFESVEQLEKMAEMGMVEGMGLALGQIDEILAA